jgi:hypothetical protein
MALEEQRSQQNPQRSRPYYPDCAGSGPAPRRLPGALRAARLPGVHGLRFRSRKGSIWRVCWSGCFHGRPCAPLPCAHPSRTSLDHLPRRLAAARPGGPGRGPKCRLFRFASKQSVESWLAPLASNDLRAISEHCRTDSPESWSPRLHPRTAWPWFRIASSLTSSTATWRCALRWPSTRPPERRRSRPSSPTRPCRGGRCWRGRSSQRIPGTFRSKVSQSPPYPTPTMCMRKFNSLTLTWSTWGSAAWGRGGWGA